MDKLPVKDNDGWFKDTQSGSFDNADKARYEKYMATYRARQKEEDEKKALQNDVSQLKSEMSEIKSLLLTLVQNQK
ncbi:gp106 [Synechococcus phage S-RIM8 A.HR3]|uniref:Gp106 n=2 Tax=Neptunevirus srim18 TaxID=2734121 RepID=A0A482MS19_9CAUD|nr:virion structural protein [Synechococcus phage S-RIM8 A.HR1]AFB15366.1 gp106 [Synechococcus phage S-RIM8 A.HR5]AFB17792.1 gp106 [Synechococcus phage S-RIM8 A.HR3]AGH57956.1 hypothetical protein CPJG_00204 [Synechococcus phage KBS-M-1A]QBQ75418.1 hypothetical protein RW030617_090 [Synechococcus phage S-RIM8]AFB17581.1 gp106 [Synechococcus phage S-RIM8 A.HR1]